MKPTRFTTYRWDRKNRGKHSSGWTAWARERDMAYRTEEPSGRRRSA